jgi:hypothetical protein
MRTPDPLPNISSRNYQAIRSLSGSDLPDTYDEWLQASTKDRRERAQAGFDPRLIEIDPNEFARYCAARGEPADGKRLLDFTGEKFAGNRY